MNKNRIVVIGAGNSGLAMAAYLKSHDCGVNLWNRSESTIANLKNDSLICEGTLNFVCKLDLISTDIKDVLRGVTLVLITTPADSHKNLASIMAPYLNENMIVILNPGRTFGAYEFRNVLINNKCKSLPSIAETQTIIFTCRKIKYNQVSILAIKKDVLISNLSEINIREILKRIPICLSKNYKPVDSIVETSIGNVGMILHCAPVLMNCGWIESPKVDFKYYYDGITPSIANFLEKVDNERVDVSVKLGHQVESLIMWLRRSYGVKGERLYDCIQEVNSYKCIDAPTSLNHRYLFEDIPMGLVPLESIGVKLGLKMSLTSLIIDLANSILDRDFRKEGRIIENLGININSLKF